LEQEQLFEKEGNILIFYSSYFLLDSMIKFNNQSNIWNLSDSNVSSMYVEENPEIQRSEIQINIQQQIQLNSEIVFSLQKGKFIFFLLLIFFKDENILYFDSLHSTTLKLAKVVEIIDESTATVSNYTKSESNGTVIFTLPTSPRICNINRNLVYKVGINLTKKGTLRSTLKKQLSSYNI